MLSNPALESSAGSSGAGSISSASRSRSRWRTRRDSDGARAAGPAAGSRPRRGRATSRATTPAPAAARRTARAGPAAASCRSAPSERPFPTVRCCCQRWRGRRRRAITRPFSAAHCDRRHSIYRAAPGRRHRCFRPEGPGKSGSPGASPGSPGSSDWPPEEHQARQSSSKTRPKRGQPQMKPSSNSPLVSHAWTGEPST